MGRGEMWYVNGMSTGIRLKDAARGIFRRYSVAKKSVKKRKYVKKAACWTEKIQIKPVPMEDTRIDGAMVRMCNNIIIEVPNAPTFQVTWAVAQELRRQLQRLVE